MSFSQPTKVENPALHFYEWRNGQLSRYDKEKKENVIVKLPFSFGVLDELSTSTGFHEPSNSGIFSNEVKKLDSQILRVRAFKGGDIATGKYIDIKDKVKANGGRYTRSIYIAEKTAEKIGSGYVISNIKFTGAAFSAWLDFTRAHNVEQGTVTLTGSVEGKKGATIYQIPTFEYGELTHDQITAFTALDQDLQKYLDRYMDTSQLEQDDSVHVDELDDSDTKASPEQVAEFERLKAEKLKKTGQSGTTTEAEDADQATYNRAAVAEIWGNDEPLPDVPPEYQ
jgi:hypothetical protein